MSARLSREELIDHAVRNEAHQSSLPYRRALKAMLALANEPDDTTIRLIRNEFRRLDWSSDLNASLPKNSVHYWLPSESKSD